MPLQSDGLQVKIPLGYREISHLEFQRANLLMTISAPLFGP